MKKSDIAMIILIASASVFIAFLVANNIPALKPTEEGVKVPTVEVYHKDFEPKPSETVFNSDAVNPTVQTIIGGTSAPTQ